MTFAYTYVAMEVSEATFKEIEAKLRAAGYEGQIHDDGATLDMHDIALVRYRDPPRESATAIGNQMQQGQP